MISSRARFVLKWARRTLAVATLLIAALVVVALWKENAARRAAWADFPPPGAMVSVGTHRLHVHCVGEGHPLVVFESDLDAMGSLSWALVQQAVSEETRTCAYDRAGFVWSEPGPRPRDAARITRELLELLKRQEEAGPYVLVGHGVGGVYARIFAGQYPEVMAGLVLVESAHPDQVSQLGGDGRRDEAPPTWTRAFASVTTRLGLGRGRRSPKYRFVPQDVYEAQEAFLSTSSLAWLDERRARSVSFKQARAVTDLGDLPITVISVPPKSNQRSALPGLTAEESKQYRMHWLPLQQELTQLSSKSRHTILEENAGHYPQFDRADAVTEAILDMVREIRKGK